MRADVRRYLRTILSEPKFIECIDNQIFLTTVLRCYENLRRRIFRLAIIALTFIGEA